MFERRGDAEGNTSPGLVVGVQSCTLFRLANPPEQGGALASPKGGRELGSPIHGAGELVRSKLPRKTSKLVFRISVPQTNRGRRGENPKVCEITLVKELGKITP